MNNIRQSVILILGNFYYVLNKIPWVKSSLYYALKWRYVGVYLRLVWITVMPISKLIVVKTHVCNYAVARKQVKGQPIKYIFSAVCISHQRTNGHLVYLMVNLHLFCIRTHVHFTCKYVLTWVTTARACGFS